MTAATGDLDLPQDELEAKLEAEAEALKARPRSADDPLPSPVGVKITIAEITDCLMDEASHIATVQQVMIDMGWRERADPKQKRRETLFVAAADMLSRLEPHLDEVKRIMSTKGRTTRKKR